MASEGSALWRWSFAAWVAVIAGFALLHAGHLRADFPNGSPWSFDWAKYTDEGWYGNAAARAHLFGNWYTAGDFNPVIAVPVWPFAEWLLYFFTGVSVQAARGLAVGCFLSSLCLSYLLMRARGPRWVALLAVTMVATSPFLYCFSRLAILEPLQTTLMLTALNLAVRLKRVRRPVLVSGAIGALMALAALTKTTGIFLLPAAMWAIAAVLWERRRLALKCTAVMAYTAAAAYALWIALIARAGFYGDFKYYFFVNDYPKPHGFYWPLAAFWWSLHGLIWVDHSLILLSGALVLAAAIAARNGWGRKLWRDPLFGCSLWAVAGYVLFMTLQNHPQPRYFAVPAFFCFFLIALALEALVSEPGAGKWSGGALTILVVAAMAVHGAQTIGYAMHPEYTWVNAAAQLTQYIDAHPNGKRLLVSISGDEITLITHLPALCDDFGTEDLPAKTAEYQPGWYASWNDIDAGTIQDLHMHFSLEQVAEFKAFDHPDRNVLVLFKLHLLPAGTVRDPGDPALQDALPDDRIDVLIDPD